MADMLTELRAFSRADVHPRYDTSEPWTQGDWTYATDTKVCVRVRAIIPPASSKDGKSRPPVEKLPQWERFPLNGEAATFPEFTDDPPRQCPECKGTGEFKVSGPHSQCEYMWDCQHCRGRLEVLGDAEVEIGGAHFLQRHAHLISRLGNARYVVWERGESKYLMFETPDGKQGMLLAAPYTKK